jgi:hypothetical protein
LFRNAVNIKCKLPSSALRFCDLKCGEFSGRMIIYSFLSPFFAYALLRISLPLENKNGKKIQSGIERLNALKISPYHHKTLPFDLKRMSPIRENNGLITDSSNQRFGVSFWRTDKKRSGPQFAQFGGLYHHQSNQENTHNKSGDLGLNVNSVILVPEMIS